MNEKERTTIKLFERVKLKELKLIDASKILDLSYRQTKRKYRGYKINGDAGVINKSRGKPSNNRILEEIKKQVIEMYVAKYNGFGPTFAAEKMLEEENLKVNSETLRLWLKKNKLWEQKRKRKKYRSRRERKDAFGELVQIDGSHHQWFENRGDKCCYFNMIDDATNTDLGLFDKEETTYIAMKTLWEWINKYGIPKALYSDKKNVFYTDREPTLEEQLKNIQPLTVFGNACKKLGIEIITANSPQAKGRVERNHGIHQDRLAKEMRLKNISDIKNANKFLKEYYLDKMNKKFSIDYKNVKNYHRCIPEGMDLRYVFCWEEERTVSNDYVVRYENRLFQIIKQEKDNIFSKAKVLVVKWLDESIHIRYKNKEIEFKEITEIFNNAA